MQNQPQPEKEMSFMEKMDSMRALMLFPALTVMVLLRHNLGYRLLNPIHLVAMAVIVFVIATLAHTSPNYQALQLFAGLMLIAGLAQRLRRWLEFQRGQRRHSLYIGDSVFEFNALPAVLRRNRRFTRWFDCLACVITGACLISACPSLGYWLILSGIALRVVEDTAYQKELTHDFNAVDGLIVSEVQADTVERFSEPTAEHQQQASTESVATGLSSDLENKIAERRKRQP